MRLSHRAFYFLNYATKLIKKQYMLYKANNIDVKINYNNGTKKDFTEGEYVMCKLTYSNICNGGGLKLLAFISYAQNYSPDMNVVLKV